jgi:predicted nucleic acid-binding protein
LAVIRFIVLDSSPLSMLTQRNGIAEADHFKQWLAARQAGGAIAVVPEIVDYELRRELIRAGKTASVSRLDFVTAQPGTTYLPLTTNAIRLAAQMWASARNSGGPTASPDALDIDVILAAQVIAQGWPTGEFVVATSNVSHLSRFVPAAEWTTIL